MENIQGRLARAKKLLIVLGLLVIGITAGVVTKLIILPSSPSIPTFAPVPKVEPTLYVEASPSSSLAMAHNSFGFDVLQQLRKEDKDKNIFISPSSISLALSMTYNGADGTTKEAMEKVLKFKGLDIQEINKGSVSLINQLQNPDPKVQIAIANSIWAKKGEKFNAQFLKTNERYYKAKTEALDFTDPGTVDVINDWVRENTKGKIPTIITPPIPKEMVMYLINAIYFKGTWTFEFDKKMTEERDFTLTDGKKKKWSMMQQKNKFAYFENELFQAVSLPYGEKKRWRMEVFLPKKSLESFTKQLGVENWNKWLKEFKETEGTVILPRFKIEYEKKLNSILSSLGMGVAFTAGANFNKMKADPRGPELFISEVLHKTFVEVNEEGTEAAAVTSVGIGITSIGGEKKTFYMEINRPFFFAISDNQTAEILFMGLINEPKD